MADHRITTAKELFDEVVTPEYQDFFGNPSTLRGAFNLARNLYHMHEWLFIDNRRELEAHYNASFASASSFWSHIEKIEPKARFIRDVTNSSKHMVLTRKASTSITHAANTFIQTATFQPDAFDSGAFETKSAVFMEDGPGSMSFDDCATAIYTIWKSLVSAFYP